jgi:hypothetical protein
MISSITNAKARIAIRSHPVKGIEVVSPRAAAARKSDAGSLKNEGFSSVVTRQPDPVKLHPVIDEPIAKTLGNLALESFHLGVNKFYNPSGFNIDQMIVMRLRHGFITGSPIAEIMTIQNTSLFKQADCAIDCGNRNLGINGRSAAVQQFDIGMIGAVRQHLGNDAALIGDPKALFSAKLFEIDYLVQETLRRRAEPCLP